MTSNYCKVLEGQNKCRAWISSEPFMKTCVFFRSKKRFLDRDIYTWANTNKQQNYTCNCKEAALDTQLDQL